MANVSDKDLTKFFLEIAAQLCNHDLVLVKEVMTDSLRVLRDSISVESEIALNRAIIDSDMLSIEKI